MKNTAFSSNGILIVNAEDKIIAHNAVAVDMLKEASLIDRHPDSVLPEENPGFSVRRIELSTGGNPKSQASSVYLLMDAPNDVPDFYKKVLDNSNDEIFVTNGSGDTIYINRPFEKNYGVKKSEILGKKFWLSDKAYYSGESPVPAVIDNKKEVAVLHQTQTGKKLFITATPVFDERENIEIIIQNVRDITQLEQVKQDLEATKETMIRYKNEIEELRKRDLDDIDNLIFKSERVKTLIDVIKRVALVESSVMLLGESGTGKSVFAKLIHKISHRKTGPFITLNCTTIPEHLLESELFGYAGGAFTGAKKEGKKGIVEMAEGGTLFLDEIGDLPLTLQSKFLELVQERHFTPVGGTKPRDVDIRIISATNRDLSKLVKEKRFREDLYYRLNVVELRIPPLRERPEDIFSMIYFFLNKFDSQYRFSHRFSDECMDILAKYSWPGNIRELRHIIEQLVVTVPRPLIEASDLPDCINKSHASAIDVAIGDLVPLKTAVETVERELFTKAFRRFGSSYKVARALDISQSTCSRKLRKYLKTP